MSIILIHYMYVDIKRADLLQDMTKYTVSLMESTCPDTLQHSSVFIDFSADFGLKILRRKFLGEVILEPNCQPELIMLLALNIPLVLF